MNKIEEIEDPEIGNFYLVRTVKFIRNNRVLNWPVIDKAHRDSIEHHLLDKPHYHIDWRFMNSDILDEHRQFNSRLVHLYAKTRSEYYSPILEKDKMSETYEKWQYLRHHDFPDDFDNELLKKDFIHIKMKGEKCPHHGTNLKGCK